MWVPTTPDAARRPTGTKAPQVNTYDAKVDYSDRVTATIDAGPAVHSGLGEGGNLFAAGVNNLAQVVAKQERQKQNLEAINQASLFRDQEREMLAQVEQLKGMEAYEQAEALATAFYDKQGKALLDSARGRTQELYYSQFLAGERSKGLDQANRHAIREFEAYGQQTFAGEQDRLMSATASDPDNWSQYAAELSRVDRAVNPGRAPGYQAALDDKYREASLETAYTAALERGDEAEAKKLFEAARTARPGNMAAPASLPKSAAQYMGLVNEAAQAYGVPQDVILGVMRTESGGKANAVSPTGVKGLMQVTQSTYKGLGFTGDRSDPRNSIMAGTKLLGQLYKQYGNWRDAFTAYNGGDGAVRFLKTGKWPQSSLNYFRKHGISIAQKSKEVRNYAVTVGRFRQGVSGDAPQPDGLPPSGGLFSPEKLMQMQKQLDRFQIDRKKEMAAEAQGIGGLITDEAAMIMDSGVGNEKLGEDIQRLEAAGVLKEGASAEYAAQKAEVYAAREWITDPVNYGLSIPEQINKAMTELAPDPHKDAGQYVVKSQRQETVRKALAAQMNALNNDPVAFVAEKADKVVQQEIAAGVLNEEDRAAVFKARTEISKQLAADMGAGVGSLKNYPLSQGQIKQIGEQINAAGNAQQRLGVLNSLYEEFGNYSEAAFKQLGVNYSELLAVEAARSGDLRLSRAAMLVANRPDKLTRIKDNDLTALVNDAIGGGFWDEGVAFVHLLAARVNNSSGQDEDAKHKLDGLLDFATGLAASMIESGKSEGETRKEIDYVLKSMTGGSVTVNEDYAAIYLKTDADGRADDRTAVLSGLKTLSGGFGDDYYWMNDGDDHFVLASRLTGKQAEFGGDKSVRVSRADAAYIGGDLSSRNTSASIGGEPAFGSQASAKPIKSSNSAARQARAQEVIGRMRKEPATDAHSQFIEKVRENTRKMEALKKSGSYETGPEYPLPPADDDGFIDDPLGLMVSGESGAGVG